MYDTLPLDEFDAPVFNRIHQVVVQEIPHAPQVVDSSHLFWDVATREYNRSQRFKLWSLVFPLPPILEDEQMPGKQRTNRPLCAHAQNEVS